MMNETFEREAFEKWAKKSAIRTDLGAWEAWKGRVTLKSAPAPCLYQIQEPSVAEQAAWHAGLDEGRAQAAAAAAAPENLRAVLIDVIAQGLSGTWHCNRVWEAWHVGTMSREDFSPVDESDTPTELADSVLAALAATQAATQVNCDPLEQLNKNKDLSEAALEVLTEQDAGLLNQAIELLHALSNDEQNRGNCSAAEGAKASAYAVQSLAAVLLATGGQAQADWWRKRADEIELQVAHTGSKEAMRCFTDMRTLLQAAAPQAQADARNAGNEWQEISTMPTCDDLIWLYCQETNTTDGPIAPDPSLEQFGWTHWAYANAPSTAVIDRAAIAAAKGE